MKLQLGGLHLQLVGLIILPLSFALLAIAVTGIRIHQDAMRQLVAERDERAVRAAAATISEQLHHRESAVFDLSRRLADGVPPSSVIEQASFLYPDFDGGLGVIDGDGLIIASNVSMDIENLPQLSSIIGELREEQAIFSNTFSDNDDAIVLVAAQGGNRAVIGAFSISGIMRSTLLGVTSGSEDSIYFLTDNTGQLLQSEGAELSSDNMSDHLGVQAALRGEVGSSFVPAKDGEHVVAFSPVQPTGWALIIEESWGAVTSPVLDLSLAAPLVLFPALLVTMIGLWFGARQVIGPIRKLQAQAEQLAHSNYEAIEEAVGGIGEIQSLQRTLAWMAQNIREAQKALQRYIGAITDAQEDERRRLARELHDETGQILTALMVNVELLKAEPEAQSAKFGERLAEISSLLSKTMEDIHSLSLDLHPKILNEFGLAPAIRWYAKNHLERWGISFSITGDDLDCSLSAKEEICLFRVTQEAITNVIRHARAQRVDIEIGADEKSIYLSIQDNGGGFDVDSHHGESHLGLKGMEERVSFLGGQIDISSEIGKGTEVFVNIPLKQLSR